MGDVAMKKNRHSLSQGLIANIITRVTYKLTLLWPSWCFLWKHPSRGVMYCSWQRCHYELVKQLSPLFVVGAALCSPLRCFLCCILELCGKTLGSEINVHTVATDMIHPVQSAIKVSKLNGGDMWHSCVALAKSHFRAHHKRLALKPWWQI